MTDKNLPSNESSKFSAWEGSSVFIEQGKHWSSSFIWLSAILLGSGLIFAFNAKIDQTVTVRGQLSPSGSVKSIDSPSSGVVRNVDVIDGAFVDVGDQLLIVEAKGLLGRRRAITSTISLLRLEAEALQSIIDSDGDPSRFIPLSPLENISDPEFFLKMSAARNQTKQTRSQLRQLAIRISSRKESLRLNTQIASDLQPLYSNGGLARNSYYRQLNSLQELKAEIATLESERIRLIGSTTSKLNALNRQVIDLTAQLSVINEAIGYRTLRAPVSGQVFDLKATPGSVVSNSEPLLKIVPNNNLQASVTIPNQDIGFVQIGQSVSVSVDSFPSGEFGYISGNLISLGSDALPPDSNSSQRYFPATISLDQQIVQSGSKNLNLQSGMSVTANIKLRSRPAISILTDLFTRQLDGIKRFR